NNQMNNNNFGKGYFTNMMLAEDGKYTNVLSEFTTDSKNYKELKYDPGVFVFYYDDLLFNDGDWSGEGGAFEYDYGVLCGSVLDYDGNDLPEITMSLKSINKKVKLDEYGNFEFNKLSAGKYDLYLSDGEKDLLCSQVEIINGKTLNLPVIMYHGKVLAQPEETDVNTTVNTVTTTTDDVEQVPYEEIVDDGYDYDDYDDFGEETEELGGYGILNGIYYDRSGKTISGAKLYISKSIYAETNKKGEFTFGKLKPAEYGIYSKVGNKFRLLKKVEVKENKIIIAKVLEAKTDNNSNLLLIILICVGGVVFLAAIAFLTALFIKKRKLSGVKA
ncbi:MAG: hypothetical protein MJ091_07315, partial [Clostridia bacterium]|nr:hypothetical protein [Clostridia bacterium]